jgi:hypothetical protein
MNFWDGMIYGFLIGVAVVTAFMLYRYLRRRNVSVEEYFYLTAIFQNRTTKDIVTEKETNMIWDEEQKAYKRKEKQSRHTYLYDRIEEEAYIVYD